jgi:lysozyme
MASYRKTAIWLTTCATFVGGFEGLALKAYPDRLARNIPTVCFGETEGVKLGDRYTKEQCTDMLANKLPRYWSEIASSIKVPVSDNEKVAYTSFAYNVGSAAFRRSSMVRKLNAGDHKGACNALLAYDMASGKHIYGLKRRRIAERNICLTPDGKKPVEVRSIVTHSPKSALAVKPQLVCTGWWIFKRCK